MINQRGNYHIHPRNLHWERQAFNKWDFYFTAF